MPSRSPRTICGGGSAPTKAPLADGRPDRPCHPFKVTVLVLRHLPPLVTFCKGQIGEFNGDIPGTPLPLSSSLPAFLFKLRLYFLERFQVPSGTEGKVHRLHIHPLPPLVCDLSSCQHPCQSGTCVPVSERTRVPDRDASSAAGIHSLPQGSL